MHKNPQWQYVGALRCDLAPPSALIDWLLERGSFMARLRAHGVKEPRVEVLSQTWEFPTLDEKQILDIPPRVYALVREVLIVSDKKQWMFARTVFPVNTLTGQQQQLARLKNRSLGSVIFKDPTMMRSEFELACITPGGPWHQKIKTHAALSTEIVWARRSVIHVQQKPLLLTEVFLPQMSRLT
jgi:chorismate--pyruvate lyase